MWESEIHQKTKATTAPTCHPPRSPRPALCDASVALPQGALLQRLTRQNEALERQVDAAHPPIRHQPASMVVSHAISANKPSRPQKSTINLPPRWALSNVDSTDHQKTQTNLKVVVNIEFFKFVG
jgi:hypothetical protein